MPRNSPCQSLEALLRTMQILRSPQGCPWDAEQTPLSLTTYILEEACELIDAIESGCDERIMDELGDLLLQVVFQAQIFTELGRFDFADIAEAINAKLVRRHPHVFKENGRILSNQELDRQWERIKQTEKRSKPSTSLSDHLPSRLPALQRAQKLVSTLRRAGLVDYLPEPPATGISSMGTAAQRLTGATLGRELFQLVMCAEEAGLDAERELRRVILETIEKLPVTGVDQA